MSICNKVFATFGILGVVLIVLAVILKFVVFENIIHDQIIQKVRLENGTEQFERWSKLPFPLSFKVYLFNVTNPDEIIELGEKPHVQEVGPFAYKLHRHREEIEYFEETDILRYVQYERYEFDRDASAYDEDTEITILNVPLQGSSLVISSVQVKLKDTVLTAVNNTSYLIDRPIITAYCPKEIIPIPVHYNGHFISFRINSFSENSVGIFQGVEGSLVGTANAVWRRAFHGDGVFHTISAKSYLFENYEFCNKNLLQGAINSVVVLLCNNVRTLTIDSETITPNEDNSILRFSFLRHKQNSRDGPYEILAGNDDIQNIGEIQSWKDLQNLDKWAGENNTCDEIKGRDSTVYPPFNTDSSAFDIFNKDICRTLNLQATGHAEYEGITGIVAELNENSFSNDGNDACYCVNQTKTLTNELECFPQGFSDMYSCLNAHVVISFPHMLWADEAYRNTTVGLAPDESKHKNFVILEPGTGSPLQGAKRIQFNMVLRRIEGIQVTYNFTPSMMPIMWVEEGFSLPQNLVDQLHDDYLSKLVTLDIITWVLIGVGVAMTVSSIAYFIWKKAFRH